VGEVDYTGVQSFIALILQAAWTPLGPNEYLRLSMMPGLEAHLPEGIFVQERLGRDTDGMEDVRLVRPVGWSL